VLWNVQDVPGEGETPKHTEEKKGITTAEGGTERTDLVMGGTRAKGQMKIYTNISTHNQQPSARRLAPRRRFSPPGVHSLVWVLNFLSFLLLYPSTFNLLEIAAVQEPKLHLWTTGVIRITRHPQTIGQVMWCAGHTLWMGTGVVATASAVLIAHHAFSVWNGDRRLREEVRGGLSEGEGRAKKEA